MLVKGVIGVWVVIVRAVRLHKVDNGHYILELLQNPVHPVQLDVLIARSEITKRLGYRDNKGRNDQKDLYTTG